MTDTQLNLSDINPQELLEKILATGKDLVKQGKSHTGDLTVKGKEIAAKGEDYLCLLYTSPSPRDATLSRMPSSA